MNFLFILAILAQICSARFISGRRFYSGDRYNRVVANQPRFSGHYRPRTIYYSNIVNNFKIAFNHKHVKSVKSVNNNNDLFNNFDKYAVNFSTFNIFIFCSFDNIDNSFIFFYFTDNFYCFINIFDINNEKPSNSDKFTHQYINNPRFNNTSNISLNNNYICVVDIDNYDNHNNVNNYD
ncbi:Oidioi.mRNA.OKI2018_I69.chr2.g4990.t1.cds [Oikopleura dioica]|uniref:Oidioi.mRNA.OKI2018_I69.chr2.g4990.t1.cds n=1 Tax=Oikopleura dioica TaxID=34765 RepID=A0ABN7SYZ9_OIKDI|nr:Oidioi.mRNA.OKI2018_I69.chr2.g4990.t1.cds [Oikopleura dioica]